MPDELKILTPIGMLGYSFSEDIFWSAVEDGVDAIILDSGSTDSGPSKLAFGQTSASREAYVRDLKILVSACHYHGVPVLIGSAAGDGTNRHVAFLVQIVSEIISSEGLRPLKVITIEAEIPKSTVQSKFDAGLVTPCGGGAPALKHADIDDAVVVVAQMGLEPWIKAMEAHPDFDMIIAGRSYDPAPYAAYCVYRGFPDLGLAYHMGKIMECGASCAVPKSAEALAIVRRDSFDIRPLDASAKCTPLSVAAHTMYEKSRPDLLAGPGGVLDVTASKFEQLPDGRTLRVSGSSFLPVPKDMYTVKLEAARVTGHMAMFIGSIRDPILISQLDALVPMIEDRLRTVYTFKFELLVRLYGKGALVEGPDMSRFTSLPTDVGVLGKVLASTQEEAKAVANLAKIFFIHAPYPGQVATAGNFIMPFSPCDIALGPAAEFCIYHLMQVDDPAAPFPITAQVIEARPSEATVKASGVRPAKKAKAHGNSRSKIKADITTAALVNYSIQLSPPAAPGFVHLASLANIIRTKNSGPFEITMDIMFRDDNAYKRVFHSNVLNRKTISSLYDIGDDGDILVCMWWEPALAFKATIRRVAPSGSFRDDDVHGSGFHVPLMYLQIPE
ncbi:hypothetical protein B0H67DRAFT_614359 [Lasiosphaeris hirsuta]|uniref:Uncharacterized protein n=1 Tax=Lasiosphaeris hirsuta TaxID=260670 RepID=A0AA39ZPI7_9PEZI|nr:hypothetical protein B0H67DRAFT_614359 [Lasiosphaeris hirsuta]